MATAKQFLETIERQKLVADDVLDRLYEQYRDSGGAVTAETLASRLVASGALPQATATALLQAPSDSFIQVGSGVLAPKAKSVPVVEDPFAAELKSKVAKGGVERDAAGRRKHVKKTHKNDFDSPLLLLGGGALALLALAGVGLVIAMNLRSGDQVLRSAEEAYAAGSYAKAYDDYAKFVEDYPSAPRWSEARVKLATVRLRQLTETSRDWDGALAIAKEELPAVEDEPAFLEHRGEFATLLPRIARGLAEAAESASAKGESSQEPVALAREALGLMNNTKYVAKSLRDQRELDAINELLGRVARRAEASTDLAAALTAIGGATESGKIADAYAAWASLVQRRPELRDDPQLAEKLAAAVEAERRQVRYAEDPADALTAEAPRPVVMTLALTQPLRSGVAAAEGRHYVHHGGVLYAVAAKDGSLAWRRPVGVSLAEASPTPIDGDLVTLDYRSGEVVRIEAESGTLVWRSPLGGEAGETWFSPAVSPSTTLVASRSGRVAALDTASGARRGYATIAQPIACAAGVDAARGVAYVAGEQSSLYTFKAATMECVGVRYTGHGPGAVTVPPVAVGGRVLLVDNAGAKTARLRVFATDEAGVVTQQLADWQLEGTVSTPARVEGRRVLVATESGAVYLFDVTVAADGPPVTLVASRGAVGTDARRCVAASTGGDVWIASVGLERTAASLADSQLIARDLASPCAGDLFVGSVEPRGGVVLHARMRPGRPGVTVGATDAKTGALVWETDLGVPPLAAPAFDEGARGVVASLVDGSTHLIGAAEARAKLSAKPAAAPRSPSLFDASVPFAGGRVLARRGSSDWLVATVGRQSGARVVTLPDSLASPPTAMGEGLLAPLVVGQVLLVSPTGQPLATPYQPKLASGQDVAWTPAAVTQLDDRRLAVLADGAGSVTCLELTAGEGAGLESRGVLTLPSAPAETPPALAAGSAAVLLRSGEVVVAELPAMEQRGSVAMPGEVVWGPHAAGDLVLLATESELMAVRVVGEIGVAWRFDLAGEIPVGEPLVTGEDITIALRDRGLTRRALADGSETASVTLGETLGSGPTLYGTKWLVSAADGAVLVVNQP